MVAQKPIYGFNCFSAFFAGKKIKNPSTRKKKAWRLFFTSKQIAENLYSLERSFDDLFRAMFAFKINKIIRFQGGPETPECREFFSKFDYKAIFKSHMCHDIW